MTKTRCGVVGRKVTLESVAEYVEDTGYQMHTCFTYDYCLISISWTCMLSIKFSLLSEGCAAKWFLIMWCTHFWSGRSLFSKSVVSVTALKIIYNLPQNVPENMRNKTKDIFSLVCWVAVPRERMSCFVSLYLIHVFLHSSWYFALFFLWHIHCFCWYSANAESPTVQRNTQAFTLLLPWSKILPRQQTHSHWVAFRCSFWCTCSTQTKRVMNARSSRNTRGPRDRVLESLLEEHTSIVSSCEPVDHQKGKR